MTAKKSSDRLLDAISSLKRAAQIPNLKHLEDHWKDGECIVFTGDRNSGTILHNLLVQALSAGHSSDYWRKHPGQGLHQKIDASDDDDIFQIIFPAEEKSCQVLAERIENVTKNLIAPEKRSR
jgi:hypothetical protein